jgi:hypothetical protein
VEFPEEIRVETAANGAPVIKIDGQPFPWYTAGIVTPPPSRDAMPTVTVTIPAERVVMINEAQPSGSRVPRDEEIARGPYRCGHPGCAGRHSLPNESCC